PRPPHYHYTVPLHDALPIYTHPTRGFGKVRGESRAAAIARDIASCSIGLAMFPPVRHRRTPGVGERVRRVRLPSGLSPSVLGFHQLNHRVVGRGLSPPARKSTDPSHASVQLVSTSIAPGYSAPSRPSSLDR